MTQQRAIQIVLDPPLYPKQREAIYAPQRYSIIEASTKSGKTMGCLVWLFDIGLEQGDHHRNYWWVAPVYQQAAIAYNRLKAGLQPTLLHYPDLFYFNDGALRVRLPNGCHLWFKTAEKPDNLYGEDVYAVVLDEATRMREEAWHAVRSTLTATRGPVRIIGNVKGRRNWVYRLARIAEANEDPTMAFFKLTAVDAVAAGVLAAEEIEDAKRKLPEHVFRELYLAEASDDGGNPFGLQHIAAGAGPLSGLPVAVWGWDLGKSVDWTFGIGLDAKGGIAHVERWQGSWQMTIRKIAAYTKVVGGLVDATGLGDPIMEALAREGSRLEPFVFTSTSKQQLMEGLAVSIQQHTVRGFHDVLLGELNAFEYEYTRTGAKYCLAPDTRVLTSDLRWVTLGGVRRGDSLLAFDEEAAPGRKTRCWRDATVLDVAPLRLPCLRVRFSDGTVCVASRHHRWLVSVEGRPCWRRTDQLRWPTGSRSPRDAPSRVMRLLDVWNEEHSFAAGYLAAAFDGEGSLSQRPRHDHPGAGFRLTFAQRENAMAEQVRVYLRAMGVEWSEGVGARGVRTFWVTGGRAAVLRLLGRVRPRRLLAGLHIETLGSLEALSWATVIDVEDMGEQDVVAIKTSTGTFVAEGLASHNCAPEGMHDDGVCALALAVQAQAQRIGLNIPMAIPAVGERSSPWRRTA